MFNLFSRILESPPVSGGECIGLSREKREILGYRLGSGPQRVSLIAGCHADEPVGALFLRHLSAYLLSLPEHDPLLKNYEWWIVPHLNPDGEQRNSEWFSKSSEAAVLASYLRFAVRELPGEDIEFGFPRGMDDTAARPENRCLYRWWSEADGVFHCHGSLHSMHVAAGPWFLLEPSWSKRSEKLMARCREAVLAGGYRLHDVERNGEKGFHRIAEGFCTRPDSAKMAQFFIAQGDMETASKFRPSSMETIRSLGGDAFTFVTEMPYFIAPGIAENIGPPDLVAERWKTRFLQWREKLRRGVTEDEVNMEAKQLGLQAMPWREQMRFQWLLTTEVIKSVRSHMFQSVETKEVK